ncbi:P-loop NTPase family protein [Streptomyces europaeiscabiei]|uniref:hypothetical protein n=1 Tax=Streptomyces europaeiscabiei TaxID=146819 RepID=UPI0038F7BBA1
MGGEPTAEAGRRTIEAELPSVMERLRRSASPSSGRYRDLARPGVVVVHRVGAKGLDFDTVVIADAEFGSAADPTSATLRMAYYVVITRARERLVLGWQGDRLPRHLEGLHGWVHVR